MQTTERKQTAFRLRSDLVEKLRDEASRENRSLNNYVESLLIRCVCDIPNKATMDAMQEARSGKELETLDLSDFKSYVASL